MTGTILNAALILLGGLFGLRLGILLSHKYQQTIIMGLGLFTVGIGLKMFIDSNSPLIVLGGLLMGGLIGEGLRIEDGVNNLGTWLERKFHKKNQDDFSQQHFIRGFMTSTILFCTGPMAILGAIQDGLLGDFQLLAIKSVMDGFAAFAMASSLGPGVLFSAPAVFTYQGAFSLFASQLQSIMSPEMITEMSATGGLLLIGISFSSLFEIKSIRVSNLIPSLVISPLIVYLLTLLR